MGRGTNAVVAGSGLRATLARHAGIGGSEVVEGDRRAGGVDNSYVSRMVMTTLAPDIVAAIRDDALPNHITLFDLAVDPPALWDEQRSRVMLSVSKP